MGYQSQHRQAEPVCLRPTSENMWQQQQQQQQRRIDAESAQRSTYHRGYDEVEEDDEEVLLGEVVSEESPYSARNDWVPHDHQAGRAASFPQARGRSEQLAGSNRAFSLRGSFKSLTIDIGDGPSDSPPRQPGHIQRTTSLPEQAIASSFDSRQSPLNGLYARAPVPHGASPEVDSRRRSAPAVNDHGTAPRRLVKASTGPRSTLNPEYAHPKPRKHTFSGPIALNGSKVSPAPLPPMQRPSPTHPPAQQPYCQGYPYPPSASAAVPADSRRMPSSAELLRTSSLPDEDFDLNCTQQQMPGQQVYVTSSNRSSPPVPPPAAVARVMQQHANMRKSSSLNSSPALGPIAPSSRRTPPHSNHRIRELRQQQQQQPLSSGSLDLSSGDDLYPEQPSASPLPLNRAQSMPESVIFGLPFLEIPNADCPTDPPQPINTGLPQLPSKGQQVPLDVMLQAKKPGFVKPAPLLINSGSGDDRGNEVIPVIPAPAAVYQQQPQTRAYSLAKTMQKSRVEAARNVINSSLAANTSTSVKKLGSGGGHVVRHYRSRDEER